MDLIERKGSGATRHPWELARAEFFLRLLDAHNLLEARMWMDVGSGDGWFAGQLRRLVPVDARITCWDANYTAEDLEALARGGAPDGIDFVVERPVGHFQRVLMLDVIEHTDDDLGFVRAIVDGLVADDGVVLVSVPAYASLFRSHDQALRHRRRYSPGSCRRILEQAGLAIVSSGGLFSSLLPVRSAQVLIERARLAPAHPNGVGNWRHGRILTGSIARALALDGRVSLALSRRGLSMPGLSYWALCRRSGS